MTESDFLRAICSNPADDLPRLMLADWLEEQAGDVECKKCRGKGSIEHFESDVGNWYRVDCPACSGTGRVSDGRMERAEFIRVQCEIAELERKQFHDEGEALAASQDAEAMRKRERELWPLVRMHYRSQLGSDWAVHADGVVPSLVEPANKKGYVGRGFIHTVSAPLPVLIGGPCERCEDIAVGWEHCEHCEDTRTIPGIASRLIGVQPVERWRATDKEPHGKEFLTIPDWSWVMHPREDRLGWNEDDRPHFLLRWIWDRLEGYITTPSARVRARRYPDEASALAALSQAIDRIAREQAGKQKQPAVAAG